VLKDLDVGDTAPVGAAPLELCTSPRCFPCDRSCWYSSYTCCLLAGSANVVSSFRLECFSHDDDCVLPGLGCHLLLGIALAEDRIDQTIGMLVGVQERNVHLLPPRLGARELQLLFIGVIVRCVFVVNINEDQLYVGRIVFGDELDVQGCVEGVVDHDGRCLVHFQLAMVAATAEQLVLEEVGDLPPRGIAGSEPPDLTGCALLQDNNLVLAEDARILVVEMHLGGLDNAPINVAWDDVDLEEPEVVERVEG